MGFLTLSQTASEFSIEINIEKTEIMALTECNQLRARNAFMFMILDQIITFSYLE
jgi:hypothetical protein